MIAMWKPTALVRRGRRLQRSLMLGALILWGSAGALAEGPALPQASVDRLRALENRLSEGRYQTVVDTARARADSAGDSASEQWARALYLQMAASAAHRLDEPGRAADLLYQARAIDAAPLANRLEWLSQEARLRVQAQQFEQAARLFDRWQGQASLAAADLWLGARIHARLAQWDQAVRWVTLAREMTDDPDASQLSLATTVYQRTGRLSEATEVVEAQLVENTRDPARWRQAVALYQRLDEPGRAAALWEAGYRRGVLEGEAALLTRVRLHIDGGTPARAGEILKAAFDEGRLVESDEHLRLLARAWTEARDRDRALRAWQQLAERTDRARDWYRLGELAYGWGDWEKAQGGLGRALERGSAPPGKLLLMQGIAAFELERPAQARAAFRQAEGYSDSAEQAQQWLAALEEGEDVQGEKAP